MSTQRRIVIGDDHPLVLAALRDALARAMPEVEIRVCQDLDAVMASVASDPDAIDLVLLDLNMPGVHGFAGLFLMLAHHPTVPVAILSAIQDPGTIRRAIACGASGYLPKSLEMAEIADAVAQILDGQLYVPPGLDTPEADGDRELARRFAALSPQQLRILLMIIDGRLNKQIAGELAISEQTVKVHVSAILRKLNVVSRTQAAVVAGRLGVAAEAAGRSAAFRAPAGEGSGEADGG